jgi:CRP-like cAMP-binding protein
VEKTKETFFKEGAYIFVEGDEDVDEIYIVESGAIELKSSYEKIKRYRTLIREGGIFGLISSLCKRPRMQSAVAKSDSVVLTFRRTKFIELVQQNPEIAFKIIRSFAEELRVYDEMLLSLYSDSETPTDDMRLFNLGEYYYRSDMYPYAHHILSKYLKLYPNGVMRDNSKSIIAKIEKTGFRKMEEPFQKGIYQVFADKQMIFCENEPGDELYIIKDGKVKIVKISDNTEIMLSVLKVGDIFGELAIVSDKPRNATAISRGITTLLPINRDTLGVLISKSPAIIYRIFMAISQRIWFTYIQLESRLYQKPLTQLYAYLENKLLEERISLKSTKSITLNFGIDELLQMTGLSTASVGSAMDLLLTDPNLNFNFGQITIEDPCSLSSKAKYYRSRDHLALHEEEKPSEEHEREAQPINPEGGDAESGISREENPIGLENEELKIPSEEIPLDLD